MHQSSAKSSAGSYLNSNPNRNVWTNYRPPATAINFSDIIEDQTIYDRTNGRIETTFNSSALDQPVVNADSMSVDDILRNSTVHEIRDLGQSRQRTTSASINESLQQQTYQKYSSVKVPPAYDDSFRPAEEMHEQLKNDEKEWANEFASIPDGPSLSQSKSSVWNEFGAKMHENVTNMSDFSGLSRYGDSGSTDFSIGRFFSDRCQKLDFLTGKSPTKNAHKPMSLIPPNAQSVSIYQSQSSISGTTYNENDESVRLPIASLSAIASHLEENDIESPRTFLNKLYTKRCEVVTKANAKLLEQAVSQNKDTKTQVESAVNDIATGSGHHNNNNNNNNFTEHDHTNKDSVYGLNFMMNSTKIDESNKENQWRNNNADDTRSYSSFSSENLTMVSPIKQHSPPSKGADYERPCANKRFLSPTSPSSTPPPPPRASPARSLFQKPDKYLSPSNEQTMSHNGLLTQKYNHLPERHFKAPAAAGAAAAAAAVTAATAPLNDVSSIMLNNLHLSSPNRNADQLQPMHQNVRRCASALKSNADNRADIDEQKRQYLNGIRSPDHMKLSLPSYGLHGLRGSYQDVGFGGAVAAATLDKRCNSQCSTHSEFTQQDGKFPLKASTSELVWECVKLRKSVSKSFVIKNHSEKKLNLKIDVFGPGFQIASSMDTNSLLLHGNECRTIQITFCPTIIGKACGKVTFRPTKNWPEEIERSVHLWAYGGSTVLQIQGIERGPVGSSFLKMGDTSTIVSTTLERTFSIYNKGPLNGVATVFLKPKTNQCINENQITIEPNKCVIRPDCTADIRVTYKLRRKDIERLKDKACEVLTVGTLEVIFGSEPNRQRIASMLTRHSDGKSVPKSYKQLEFLVHDFPSASTEPFTDYREKIENVPDLFGCFRTAEIALTINRTFLDETRNADFTCIDDSVLFRTLVETPKQSAKSHPFQ